MYITYRTFAPRNPRRMTRREVAADDASNEGDSVEGIVAAGAPDFEVSETAFGHDSRRF